MGHGTAFDVPIDAVEADVGNVMLCAGVEATADLDAEAANGLVELQVLLAQTPAEFGGKTAAR